MICSQEPLRVGWSYWRAIRQLFLRAMGRWMKCLKNGKEPVSTGLYRGKTMTLEIRDLSYSCQCSRKDESFSQFLCIRKPTCLEWGVLRISCLLLTLAESKLGNLHPVTAEWSLKPPTRFSSLFCHKLAEKLGDLSSSDSSIKRKWK